MLVTCQITGLMMCDKPPLVCVMDMYEIHLFQALEHALSPICSQKFLDVAMHCGAVICCRLVSFCCNYTSPCWEYTTVHYTFY